MRVKTLGEICNVASGGTPSRSQTAYWNDGTIPWIKIGNIKGKYVNSADEYITQEGLDNSSAKMFPKGTILYTIFATLGEVGILTIDACTNQAIAGITVKDHSEVLTDYLFYYLKSKKVYVNGMGRGAAQNNINMSILRGFEVPLPDISEQHQIAFVLDMVENLCAFRKQQLAKLDELVKARFVEIFGNPEHNEKQWDIFKLDTLCSVSSSKRIYQNELSMEGVPFLRISDLVNRMDTGSAECELYIPEERYEELKTLGLVPAAGDMLITARGTLGRCYILTESDRFYFQDGMITWLYDFDKALTTNYLTHLFAMSGFRKQIDTLQAGSTVAYLSISMTKKLDVMLPPLELQNQFAAFVEQTDKAKLTIQASLDKLETLEKALLQKCFG